nr:NADH-ubiquinone oxidoreductase subunit 2 [Ophiocordyceps sp.]
MIILIYCILNDLSSLTVTTKGVGIHGGLLLVTNITQIFHIFIFLISILILTLTSFYPRNVLISKYSSLKDLILYKFIYYIAGISSVRSLSLRSTSSFRDFSYSSNQEQKKSASYHLKIIEYPLILLFVITGSILLMSTNDLVSIFLAIELQSYGLYILSTIYRNSELSTTGGLIYFLLGGLSSCFIVRLCAFYYILLMSSLFSLIIGTVVGLTQFRIKRLFAYSTISHVGFILLALGISSIESTQAFIFYLTQYTISNLNAFFILVAIGFSLYCYTSDNKEHEQLIDKTNSPVQLVNQLKGYFYINPVLALSLAITIFSFVGVPPLIGFFGKQMVLSAAIDKGLIFLSLIAILTSVIGAIYYLNIIKEMFFSLADYKINTLYNQTKAGFSNATTQYSSTPLNLNFKYNIAISSPISFVISCITMQILLFLFINKEWLSMGKKKSKSYSKKIGLNNKIVRHFGVC